ncbi:hypothetical protein JTE90_022211 [Oedothorax gibbosus]|uniref:Family with sequence similarity 113 n=1 Tax=Oedothorax gibbosus TaxID=931172 RepID=A0AAV6UC42_9ARAC|nr:hypothetical protein JTE90_022211 [Oedothorax gibbosus]
MFWEAVLCCPVRCLFKIQKMDNIAVFLTKDLKKLMKNKKIIFMGDSNIRAIYKDFLCLMKDDRIIPDRNLRAKLEDSVFGDRLLNRGEKTNARVYREERRSTQCHVNVYFYFITKVFDEYVEDVLSRLRRGVRPDVLIVNSFLWDISRWGADGVDTYKRNLNHLMDRLQSLVPDCLVIWMTTPPLSKNIRGGFLIPDLEFLKYSLRFHVLEGNNFASEVVINHGFDVVDAHYHLQHQIHRRADDGVHWKPKAVRFILNLLLSHISVAFNVPLPNHGPPQVTDDETQESGDQAATASTSAGDQQAAASTSGTY